MAASLQVRAWLPIATAALCASTSGFAETFMTPEAARIAMFGPVAFTAHPVTLTAEQIAAIKKQAGVSVRSPKLDAWRSVAGDWFIVDQVLGKHEFITLAVGIDAGGKVKGIEILEYRETYGGQVRHADWREHFVGKTAAAPLKLDQDIPNISGATLSSRHVTEGVRRLLVTYDLVLRRL